MSDQKVLEIFETLETRNEGDQKSVKAIALKQLKGLPSSTARGKGRLFVELFYEATIDAKENALCIISQELLKSFLPSRYSLVITRLILLLLEDVKKLTVRATNTLQILMGYILCIVHNFMHTNYHKF